jgi:hypothetical protein
MAWREIIRKFRTAAPESETICVLLRSKGYANSETLLPESRLMAAGSEVQWLPIQTKRQRKIEKDWEIFRDKYGNGYDP